MGNKVDMSEVENFSNDLKAASADIKSSLNQVEEQIEQINSMTSFSGKAAKSAKQYFGDMHLTILESFKGLFEDLEENLHQHMKTFESKVDASDSAVIRSNYLQDVKEDINETFEDLRKQDEIIYETIKDVSDISSATPPSFSDVDEWKKEAVKEVKELEEDLEAFTSEGNETDVKELMQQIEAVMNNAKTSEGQARFADFKGASEGSDLAKLKAYNLAKTEDEEKQIEQLDPQSQAYLEQAQADYDKKEIDKATYEAIRLGIIQNGPSFIKSASNGKFPVSVSEQVEEDIGQWADNLYENQEGYQNMVGQGNLNSQSEDEQLAALMAEGYFEGDDYDVNKYKFPEDEPLGFWDKHAVMAKDSSLAGTPDGLAGPAAFTFDALKKPASISSSAAKEEAILDRLPDEIAGPAAMTFDVAKGVDDGVEDVIDDFLVGTATMAGHPIETGKSLLSAVANPTKTANIMADAISTSYNRDVTNGDAESRSRWFSYATTTIGTSFIGASGPNAASKVSRVGSSATNSVNRFKFNNPFEPQPALSAEGIDVPYNVYNGETIKNQTFQFAKKFDGGQKKAGPNAENNYLSYKDTGNKLESNTIKKYIRDVEGRTNRELPENQTVKLKKALRNKEYQKLSPIETAKHRADFDKVKNKVIREWEENTGQKWPVYNENVISEKTGKIIRKKNDRYDAHHIIENTFGGEHEWWNMHPAKFPNEHQAGIHGTGSPANTLFKGDKK